MNIYIFIVSLVTTDMLARLMRLSLISPIPNRLMTDLYSPTVPIKETELNIK